MSAGELSKKIVRWYRNHHRKLPWRETNDPYCIWLSEIILQQTRVDQGLPYYQKFLKRFPNLRSLAVANERSVLRLWQGLGYYSRARNMLRCARILARDFDACFPSEAAELVKLPGIGNYTAAAIASIAFRKPEAVVDGNVFRVLARLYAIPTPTNSTEGVREFRELARSLISKKEPGLHNQALMELGALICTPASPACNRCPLTTGCVAKKTNSQDRFPVKIGKARVKKRYFYYFVFVRDGDVFMNQRIANDIWKGLYDFPLVQNPAPVRITTVISQMEKQTGVILTEPPLVRGPYRTVLTHQLIESRFLVFENNASLDPFVKKAARYYHAKQILKLPKPVLINKFLNDQQLF